MIVAIFPGIFLRHTFQTIITLMRKQQEVNNSQELFQKYQHNQELVKFINHYSSGDDELGAGWELKTDQKNRTFYVNHVEHFTTYFDPRALNALHTSDEIIHSQSENSSGNSSQTGLDNENSENRVSTSSIALSYPDQGNDPQKNGKQNLH